jgi:hypothetical protein
MNEPLMAWLVPGLSDYFWDSIGGAWNQTI